MKRDKVMVHHSAVRLAAALLGRPEEEVLQTLKRAQQGCHLRLVDAEEAKEAKIHVGGSLAIGTPHTCARCGGHCYTLDPVTAPEVICFRCYVGGPK